MSLVNTGTGEIVSDLTPAAARRLVDKIRGGVDAIWVLVQSAYDGRAWVALGYESWDSMCETEFAGARIRLPRPERVETVRHLRDAGMSTRAIGSALGVSQATVAREARESFDSPAPVVGLDGKRYAPTAPTREPLVLKPELLAQDRDESRRGAPIAGIGRVCRDLIALAGDDPGRLIAESPDYMLRELEPVAAALDALTHIHEAMGTR